MIAATRVIAYKEQHPDANVRLIAVFPFVELETWKMDTMDRLCYKRILNLQMILLCYLDLIIAVSNSRKVESIFWIMLMLFFYMAKSLS
ncbi:MAG: hypothetical protein SNH79_04445 [Rikenellaceae bacterium]